jgi:phytoene dehydrogenase-like protein
MERRAVIIGAGLGGLLFGEMLSRNGFKVFVAEK